MDYCSERIYEMENDSKLDTFTCDPESCKNESNYFFDEVTKVCSEGITNCKTGDYVPWADRTCTECKTDY